MNDDRLLRPMRVALISLGCAKNLVDAEIMLGALLKEGVEITNDAAQADVLIVNTCSFIDAAQEESVDTILESAEVRQAVNRRQGLVVAGCLPQRFRAELPNLLPEVDAFMGIDQVTQVGQIVRRAFQRRAAWLRNTESKVPSPKSHRGREVAARLEAIDQNTGETLRGTQGLGQTRAPVRPKADPQHDPGASQTAPVEVTSRPQYIPDYATPRFRLTPRHFAYVKIAEGCNHPCSFCIIPRIRGSHRSRRQTDIVAEARGLIAEGVKELNLISQDSTYYGMDLRAGAGGAVAAPGRFAAVVRSLPVEATTICSLLHELNGLPGDFWIRLLYTHPAHWTDELIATIAACRKVARYVDIPLQHIHENMLERMRRETSRQYIADLLTRIRVGVPGIALRTTFIVGFPGETEECFEALLDFMRETRFERLGVFTYSQEENTRAGKMAGQVPDKVKRERRDRAMAAQHQVAVAVAESFMGRTLRVLVEGEAQAWGLQNTQVGSREHGFIREAGPAVHVKGHIMAARGEADAPDIDGRVYVRSNLPAGDFAQVRIVGHTDYDLLAVPA